MMKSKKYQLKNGLKVLLLESRKSPVVSIQMWVKTGSADETKKLEGISHFIEHLVFKGTRKFKVGEIAQTIEGSGGELNAYTSFDQTVFYVTLSKDFTNTGLEVISEMMGFPTFDQTEVNNEREVVVEEIKMGEDSPERQASQALFKTMFKNHPYGVPVIGFAENIRKVKLKELQTYFQSRYVPKNMFLVVSGDFNSQEMSAQVKKYFGGFEPYKLKTVKRKKEPPQTKARISIKQTDFKKSILYLAWRAPSVQHKDVPALDVLSLILGQGDSSRLTIKLRIDKAIVNAVGASAFTPQDPGFLAITMHLEREKIPEALEVTAQEIAKIIFEPPSSEEMQKAINNLASEQLYSVETVDGIAQKAGSMEFYTGDFNYFSKYLKQIYSLTPADIQKVAKKYFNNETLNMVLQTNEGEVQAKKELEDFAKSLKKQLSAKRGALKSKPSPFKFKKLRMHSSSDSTPIKTETWKHDSGIKVVFRKQSETPTVSLRIGFSGGARFDAIGKEGQTELLSRTWSTGSENFSESEINHRVDTMAASLSTFGGRNTIGVTCDFLNQFTDDMLEIVTDTIRAPLFSEEQIEREKEILLRQIKSRSDQPSSICMKLFLEKLFGEHPYGRDVYGTEATLKHLHSRELKKYFEQVVTPSNMTIAVVGDINKAKIEEFAGRLAGAVPQRTFKAPKFGLAPLVQDERVVSDTKKEQTHIVVGYRGLDIHDPNRFTLQIIQSVLAGQGGRLFVELRDKNSLAYSVSPMRMEGLETGYFGAYIGCSPEKAEKAIGMINHEFKRLTKELISEEELLRAQRHLIGRHNIDLQRKSSICQGLLLDTIYGIDPEETFHISDKYFLVSREDVMELSKRIFSQKSVTSLVGPQNGSNGKDKGL
jgi:zinc protease